MAKVKGFPTLKTYEGVDDMEVRVNQWIASVESSGGKIIQLAASDSGEYGRHTLWVLYEEPKVRR